MSSDPADPDFDLSAEFDRLVREGAKAQPEITIKPATYCDHSMFSGDWIWYEGLTDCFHFCRVCDFKNRFLPRPKPSS